MAVQFRTKIFIGSVVAAIVSLVASDLWLARQVREEQQAALVDQLTAEANLIAHSLRGATAGADFDSLAHDVGRVVNSRVTLIAADGRVLGDSTQSPAGRANLDNHGTRPEVLAAGARGVGQIRRYSDTVSMDMLYVAVATMHPVVRFVRLAKPATEVDAQLRAMRQISLIALAVGVPLALLVAWMSTAPLARRVQAMAGAAKAFKAGDLDSGPRDFGSDELGSVAHTLDDVARELSRRLGDLSQDRARIDAIVAGMVEGVLVVDSEGHIQRINAAARQLLGVGENVMGKPFAVVLRDAAITDQLSRALQGQADTSVELSLQRSPSRTIVARASAVPSDRGGGAVVVLHDISDIRRVDRMRQDFVANVSHELRTPLTVVRGYAEALAEGSVDQADVAEFGSVITRHATKMERLVADLLRLARLDAHQETLALAPCDLKGVFEDIVEDLKPLIESKRQRVVIHIAPGAQSVVADGAKIHDVLRNLVENAVTYSPESAEIRLEAWSADNTARLTVADNGPGIPVQELPRIFERFYRVDPSRARPGGTGLGLAIVKHLVELHGGSVSAGNSSLGGAVFTVVLPQRVQPAEARSA
jgi:two-component system, OmpR family, phosphate regulon sensor histidine kinase PhoR